MDTGSGAPASMRSEEIHGFGTLETGIVAIYGALYDRIFWDLELAEEQLGGSRIDYADLIHAAAHLRLVIEQVALASFVASHRLISTAGIAISNSRDFDRARKTLRKPNPHYWPVSFGQVERGGQVGLGVRPDIGLREKEVGQFFGAVSEVLHAQSPYVLKKVKPTPDQHLEQYQELTTKLRVLLDEHIIQLAEHPEYIRLRHVDGENRVDAFRTEVNLLG